MRIVNIHEAKTHLSRFVEASAAGEEIIIAKAGKAQAKLGPITSLRPKRVLGSLRGQITVSPDFDAPLPPDMLNDFEGR